MATTLSEQLDAISAELHRLSESVGGIEQRNGPDQPTSADDIRRHIRTRRLRHQMFPGAIFADPAWDIMLDLLAARMEGKRVSVSSLCIAAAVPPTTALRWIQRLTDRGILVRSNDPVDGRRVFMALSEVAAEKLQAYFARVRPSEA